MFLALDKKNGLKVYKFRSIQNQEEHIGPVKQSKSDRFRVPLFFLRQRVIAPIFFSKSENLTLTKVFINSYVISPSYIFCLNKSHQKKQFESL